MFLSVSIPFISFCCYLKLQSLKYKMALLIFLQGSFWAMALGCVAVPILHRLNLVEITNGLYCVVGLLVGWSSYRSTRRWCFVDAGVVPDSHGVGLYLSGEGGLHGLHIFQVNPVLTPDNRCHKSCLAATLTLPSFRPPVSSAVCPRGISSSMCNIPFQRI